MKIPAGWKVRVARCGRKDSRERFTNAERKGKESGVEGKARESSIAGSTNRRVVGGREQNGFGRVYLSIAKPIYIHSTGIPFINLPCFRTTQDKISNWHCLFPPTPHSKLVRYDSVFFVGTVFVPGVSQTVETHGLARSASPQRKRRTKRQSDIEAGSRPDSPSRSLISMASTARSKGLSVLK